MPTVLERLIARWRPRLYAAWWRWVKFRKRVLDWRAALGDKPEHVRCWARVRSQRGMIRLLVGERVKVVLLPEGEGGPDLVRWSDGDFDQWPVWVFTLPADCGPHEFPAARVSRYCEGIAAVFLIPRPDGSVEATPLNALGRSYLEKYDETAREGDEGGVGRRKLVLEHGDAGVPAAGAGR